MDYKEEIRKIIEKQNGTLLSSDLTEENIPRTYLKLMVEEDELEYVDRGVYVGKEYVQDDMYALQKKYPKIIYSHETALYLHGLSDRIPSRSTITVPSGYKAVGILAKNCKTYYVKKELHRLGVVSIETPFGNTVSTYDVERTVCDILRSRNRIDVHVLNDALKRYVNLNKGDYSKLMNYAEKFNIDSVVKRYLEMLL